MATKVSTPRSGKRSATARARSASASKQSGLVIPAGARLVQVVPNPYEDAVPGAGHGRTKESPGFALFAEQFNELGVSPENQEPFERLLRKFSNSTTWVYVCVMRIAQAAAQLAFQTVKRRREGKPHAIETGKVGGLRDLLENPNPYQSRFDFIENLFVHLELTGNAFIEKAEMDGNLRPKELYPLNPASMLVIPDKKRLVRGYLQNVNGKNIEYKPEQIIHIKYAHPSNQHYGLSPATAARIAIDTDQGALKWNQNFMNHGGWPAGSIETEADVDDKTLRRLKNELRTVVMTGKDQAGRVMLLTGGMKYHAIAISPKDMDWLDARRFSRDELLAIYNVPFSIAGLTSTEQTTARSAGIREQARNFYHLNIFPKMNGKVLGALNRELVPAFSKEVVLRPDVRAVPVLQEDLARDFVRAQTFQKLVASGWSINMALAELYPHQNPVAWGDVFWVQSAMVPVDDGENPLIQSQIENANKPTAKPKPKPKPGGDKPEEPEETDAFREGIRIATKLGINHGTQREIASLFYDVSQAESESEIEELIDRLNDLEV